MRGEYSIQEDPIWEKKTGEEDQAGWPVSARVYDVLRAARRAAPTISVDAWWYWISYRIRPWFRWAMISSCRLYWSNAHWAGLLRIY